MADPTNTLTIAFIGFGELGQTFCRDLAAVPGIRLQAYDIVFDDPAKAESRQVIARDIGVRPCVSAAEACDGAAIVISAVTADRAYEVAAGAAALMRPGQVFLDVNSASPGTKVKAAAAVQAKGADYVEGAVMGAVKGNGIRVEILAGGPAAEATAERLNARGMNLKAVSRDHGKASAIKLCRSIMIKGIEALLVDCSKAVAHWDVADPVYASLARTFPGTNWHATAETMNERVATHGVRRSAEMYEAADMVRELGMEHALIRAVADAQLRGAAKKP